MTLNNIELNKNEFGLLSIINSYCVEYGNCCVGNKVLSKKLKIDAWSLNDCLKKLKETGLVSVEYSTDENGFIHKKITMNM